MSSKSLKERIAELRSREADLNSDSVRLSPRSIGNAFTSEWLALRKCLPIIEAQEQEIERLKKLVEDIGKFSECHHSDEDPCRWLHALKVDIPSMAALRSLDEGKV